MTPVPRGSFPDECEQSYYPPGSIILMCRLSGKRCFCTRTRHPELCHFKLRGSK